MKRDFNSGVLAGGGPAPEPVRVSSEDLYPGGRVFSTTHWSVVLAAAGRSTPASEEALDRLCRAYWFPLYGYIRRQGARPDDAEDLTQAFFAHLLRRDFLSSVGPNKGKFRSFLLASLKHFLADERGRARALKRRADAPQLRLNLEDAERRYRLEGCADATAESLYDRDWAIDVLNHAVGQLRDEIAAGGREALLMELEACLLGEGREETYRQLATRLGISETAVKVSVHRLRQRFRGLLRNEIAQTVGRIEDIREEMHYLFEVVSR